MACMVYSAYFPKEETRLPCAGRLLVMPKFWCMAADGNLDAVICERHAEMHLRRWPTTKSYLTERILQERRMSA